MPPGRTTQAADLASGIQTLRRLEEVTEADAEGETKAVYEDLQATLRVPFVNALFRVLAAGPPFLAPAWRTVAPVVSSVAFERSAAMLRAEAAERVGTVPRGLTLELPDAEDAKVRDHLDSYHFVLPKLALVAELFDRVARSDEGGKDGSGRERLPRGPAKGTRAVPLKESDAVDGAVRRTFKEIQRTHDHPLVASFYRGLANWPLVLQRTWGVVSPAVGTEPYLEVRDGLQKRAFDLVADTRLDLGAVEELRDADLQEVRDLLAVFRMRMIPDILQDVTRIKLSLDGSATHSRFDAVRPGS